jgi:hypothetical protein
MRPFEKSKYRSILAAFDYEPMPPAATDQVLNHEILELSSSLALSQGLIYHQTKRSKLYLRTTSNVCAEKPAKFLLP